MSEARKMKIAILSRGPELYSTKSLLEAGLKRGHDVVIVDHTKCSLLMEKGKPTVYYMGVPLDDFDAIIPRIGTSVTEFGTSVVRNFEMAGVITTASAQSIEISRNKLKTLQIFSKFKVGIPKTAFAKYPKKEDIPSLIKNVGGAPLIIKVLEGTQGLGVVLVESIKGAKSVIEAFSSLKANILLQEFIAEAGGADIRAFIVNGKVVAAMKRQGAEGEFRSNIHQGGTSTTFELDKKGKSAATKAAKALGLPVCGVDLIQSNRGALVMEVNSSPGLEGIETTTGIDVASRIYEYLEAKYGKKLARKKSKKTETVEEAVLEGVLPEFPVSMENVSSKTSEEKKSEA